MALINSFEKEGNWLFKRRGTIPVLLFILALPFIFLTEYDQFNPELITAVNWISVFISMSGFVIRAYTIGTTPRGTSGRNTESQVAEQVNTSGIYSMVRHPLYLGNYLMWIGIVLFTKNIYFVIITSLLYWIYYERIMFAEERFLERKFGQQYMNWAMQVPAFLPSFKRYRKSEIPFSVIAVLRREYSGVLATVAGFVYVEVVIGFARWNVFTIGRSFVIVGIVALATTLLLRSLKHYTGVLNEEGRS